MLFIFFLLNLYTLSIGFFLGTCWLMYSHDDVRIAMWIFNITCAVGSTVLAYKYCGYKPTSWFPYSDKTINLFLARCATFLYS